jgi:hypothetical protein
LSSRYTPEQQFLPPPSFAPLHSSFFLLLDKSVSDIVVSATVFPKGEYSRFYLALLSFTITYYGFSAARILPRTRGHGKSEVSSNWIDWGLALLGIFTGLVFLTSSI